MRRAKTATRNAEKRDTPRRGREPSRGGWNSAWTWTNLSYDDETGVDRDIETILDLVQRTEGCTRDKASAELVRRLSFAA